MTGTSPLLSFHNDIAVKQKYLKRLEAHYEADKLIILLKESKK
jgi:hypothetical protein